MILLGINLLGITSLTEKIHLRIPRKIFDKIKSFSLDKSWLSPILLGASTFFLPCGFTQSMQIYTLSTKNFLDGGLTMLFFAIGTLPVLAIISFTSIKISGSKYSSIFFKTAGIIVLVFALLNIINSLAGYGIVKPLFTF
jgi:sulfite exporter TauE/SafE